MNKLKDYAVQNNVPIIEDDGLEFIINLIKQENIKSILEVGTAIGYSAINFAYICDDIYIKTIERDKSMYEYAMGAIKDFNLENRIKIVFGDAKQIEIDGEFDMVFIDAAKSSYKLFFDRFSSNLSRNGIIVCDNMNFHGQLEIGEEKLSRGLRGIVRKLKTFREYLVSHKDYDTNFYNIGDGISVSRRVWK